MEGRLSVGPPDLCCWRDGRHSPCGLCWYLVAPTEFFGIQMYEMSFLFGMYQTVVFVETVVCGKRLTMDIRTVDFMQTWFS